MNPYTFVKDARRAYLEHLAAGGREVPFHPAPHESSGTVAVYDSDLGNCPKKAALSRNHVEPTHPNLSRPSLGDMHRMRSGVVAEKEWIATLRYFDRDYFDEAAYHPVQWSVGEATRVNDDRSRGKIDAHLSFEDWQDRPTIDGTAFTYVAIEFKRTDGELKDSYLYQLCSYLRKMANLGYDALGKLILDHRHTIKEYTVLSIMGGWVVLDEDGRKVQKLDYSELMDTLEYHNFWMTRIANEPDNPHSLPPKGHDSPLHSWECHQDWHKREGVARFRCPFAGYCFGIAGEQFEVTNEKQGNKIIARVVVSDTGVEYRYQEKE